MGPKERGRGAKTTPSLNSNSGGKRTAIPNIAAAASRILAPKWADSKPNASDASIKSEHINGETSTLKSERGAGRGRPRGRGKGRGGSKSFIASEGVFSQGIGEDIIGSQRTRGLRLKNIKDEEIIGKLENSLHADTIDDIKGNQKSDRGRTAKEKKVKLEPGTSENLYEEFWQSDDELDIEELDELCGGSFITDLKKCEQVPFVLPNNEAQQFNQIVKKRRKEEEQGQYTFKDIKDIKIKEISSLELFSGRTESCLKKKKFQLTSSTIQRIANDNDLSDQLLLFQLPSVPLLRIAKAQKQPENEKQGGLVLPSEKTLINSPSQNRLSSTQEPQVQQKNCLETFGGGTRIGKLQFLRSGKAVFNIGGIQMDISESINSECFETLLRVEVAGDKQQSSNDNNLFGSPFGLNNGIPSSLQQSTSGYGCAHLLGSLPFHFVCSFDIKRELENTK